VDDGAPAYAQSDAQLLAGCRLESLRGSGPGGQHRNRTESGVRVVHAATGLEARADRQREHRRNQAEALARLRLRLAIAIRGQAQPAWLEPYRKGSRLPLGASAAAYPLAVACALDALDQALGRLPEAAAGLGLSSSQLAKLLTADGEVRLAADRLRAGHGFGPLHD
jgi:hypothetical protein